MRTAAGLELGRYPFAWPTHETGPFGRVEAGGGLLKYASNTREPLESEEASRPSHGSMWRSLKKKPCQVAHSDVCPSWKGRKVWLGLSSIGFSAMPLARFKGSRVWVAGSLAFLVLRPFGPPSRFPPVLRLTEARQGHLRQRGGAVAEEQVAAAPGAGGPGERELRGAAEARGRPGRGEVPGPRQLHGPGGGGQPPGLTKEGLKVKSNGWFHVAGLAHRVS